MQLSVELLAASALEPWQVQVIAEPHDLSVEGATNLRHILKTKSLHALFLIVFVAERFLLSWVSLQQPRQLIGVQQAVFVAIQLLEQKH